MVPIPELSVVETDRVIYRAGEPIVVTARAYDDQQRESNAFDLTAQVRSNGQAGQKGPGQKVALTPAAAGTDYTGSLDSESLAAPLHQTGGDINGILPGGRG